MCESVPRSVSLGAAGETASPLSKLSDQKTPEKPSDEKEEQKVAASAPVNRSSSRMEEEVIVTSAHVYEDSSSNASPMEKIPPIRTEEEEERASTYFNDEEVLLRTLNLLKMLNQKYETVGQNFAENWREENKAPEAKKEGEEGKEEQPTEEVRGKQIEIELGGRDSVFNTVSMYDFFKSFTKYLGCVRDAESLESVRTLSEVFFVCFEQDFRKIDKEKLLAERSKREVAVEKMEDSKAKAKKSKSVEKEQHRKKLQKEYQNFKTERIEFFVSYYMKNFKVYNAIIKNHPQLTRDVLKSPIAVIPSILDFENKRTYFRAELKKIRQGNHDPINIMVNR